MSSIADIQLLFSHPIIKTFNSNSQKVFSEIASCHAESKGKHVYKCDNKACGHIHYQYHSCGNRHCLFCGSSKRDDCLPDFAIQAGVKKLTADLLPTSYYHSLPRYNGVVFTVPLALNSFIMRNRKSLFTLLFDSAKDTLLTFGKDKKYLDGTVGITTILHTWGQEMNFHPHVHCIVSGGGISDKGKWIEPKRKEETFLFPVQAMKIDISNVLKIVADKTWNVCAKSPFKDVSSVVKYLGRYSHKVALSHHRIKTITDSQISFNSKDYQDSHRKKVLTVTKEEFLRRMKQHN